MKVKYDEEVDVLTIKFSDAPIEESDQDKPGVILDYDKAGNIVGLEIRNASKRILGSTLIRAWSRLFWRWMIFLCNVL